MTETIGWNWAGHALTIRVERLGTGPSVLMLPALSSISSLGEMRPLQERLADRYATIAVDWPGFGTEAKPMVGWTPEAMLAFLDHVLAQVALGPYATIAAGHAAGYLLKHVAAAPGSAGRLCLTAPTWRGPLPTVTGKRSPWLRQLARVVDLPVLGAAIYRLNVSRPVVAKMVSGHVYADRAWLTAERLAQKSAVTRAPGARHASGRFVTGLLDPFHASDAFVAAARKVTDPILVIYGADTPRRSKAEMAALAALPNVETMVLDRGKLSVHEEFAAEVAERILAFLAEQGA